MNSSVTDTRPAPSSGRDIPKTCEPFVTRFEEAVAGRLAGLQWCREHFWNGERLFLSYEWRAAGEETIARLRLQLFPVQGLLWLGSLTVHSAVRGRGIGTFLVRALEQASSGAKVGTIRMFSQRKAAGFWSRLGYRPEQDPRYFVKWADYPGNDGEENLFS